MTGSVIPFLAIMVIALITVLGDYFLKIASTGPSIRWLPFIAGATIYGLTAFGWVYGMRHLKLATLGVVFAITMVLFMAALGTIVFRESLSYLELLGIVLAFAALLLLARHG